MFKNINFIFLKVIFLAQGILMANTTQQIQNLMKTYKAPGCLDNIQSSLIDEYTLFPIASLTKHFTAVSIGILVDRTGKAL